MKTLILLLLISINSLSQNFYYDYNKMAKERREREEKIELKSPEVSRIVYEYLYSLDTLTNGYIKSWRFKKPVKYIILLKVRENNKETIHKDEVISILNNKFNILGLGFLMYKGIQVPKTPIITIEIYDGYGFYNKDSEEYDILGTAQGRYIKIIKYQEYFESTLLHEFGHILELRHVNDIENVMFYRIEGSIDYKIPDEKMKNIIKKFYNEYSKEYELLD